MKKGFVLILLIIAGLFVSCDNNRSDEIQKPVNVIFFVVDGFSPMSWSIVRAVSAGMRGTTNLDRIPHTARYTTYSNDSWITDSAASMTAMISGHKTNNGVINQDSIAVHKKRDGIELLNLRNYAASKGMLTGIITTTEIYHATPAGCFASTNNRREYPDIARQLVENNYPPEIIIGGGRRYMLPESITDSETGEPGKRKDNRNLIMELQNKGYKYMQDTQSFNEWDPSMNKKVLGLFDYREMRFESDRKNDVLGEPALWEIVDKALSAIKNTPRGFFLMIESGLIDYAAHSNAADTLIYDCIAFDKTVGVILDFIEDNPNTLLLIASDHATATPAGIGIGTGADSVSTHKIPEIYRDDDSDGFPDKFDVEFPITVGWASNPISMKRKVGQSYSKGSHTADDCLAYGAGYGSEIVNGFLDNTDLYNILRFYLPDDKADGTFINLSKNAEFSRKAPPSTVVFTAELDSGVNYTLEILDMNGSNLFKESGISSNTDKFDIIWHPKNQQIELPGIFQYCFTVNEQVRNKHTFIVR